MTFTTLTKRYVAQGCPDKQGVRRTAPQIERESRCLDNLRRHFRDIPMESLTIRHCAEYCASQGHRQRAADMDLQTLSNLCWFGVFEGVFTTNPVLRRARCRKACDVRHCREVMPADAAVLHRVAGALLANQFSAASGWQMLFEAFTGCRTVEVLALRTDARSKTEPGFVEANYLYVRRAKRGGSPFVFIQPELRELLAAHAEWKAEAFPDSPWYFPGQSGGLPLTRCALTRRLDLTCRKIGVPKITSHGLRAYFVTLQRSRGLSNEQVAAMIGDRTSALIDSTYGALPEVWSGGEPLAFIPAGGPAWKSLLTLSERKGVAA